MRKLLLCAVALSSLTACVVTPGYRTADGTVVPPDVYPAFAPPYGASYDDRYNEPYAIPVSARSCRAERSDCQIAIHRCWKSEGSCVEARNFCERVQSRCGSFY